ncbi:MAG: CBS domain-containing protein [Anaerolineales bacterium]|nr:MAG: CBS domain-containing protein [Anaerolineales bacterium]
MLIGERMSQPVITIHPDVPVQEAIALMTKEGIRRLPVVDQRGQLIGIVTNLDLLHASPSDATSLSVWELNYLISKITVDEIMSKDVITVAKDLPVEEAARIMADNKIGGLPVVEDHTVIGIITETDLFKIFLELLGAREAGIRITALMPDMPGELAKLTMIIRDLGGNIVALTQALGESSENRLVTVKVSGVDIKDLQKAVEPEIEKLIDIRESKLST